MHFGVWASNPGIIMSAVITLKLYNALRSIGVNPTRAWRMATF